MIDMVESSVRQNSRREQMVLATVCWRGGMHCADICARAIFGSFLDDAMTGMLGPFALNRLTAHWIH